MNLASKVKPVAHVSIEDQQRFDALLSHRKTIIKIQAFIRGFLARRRYKIKRSKANDIDLKVRNHSREVIAAGM